MVIAPVYRGHTLGREGDCLGFQTNGAKRSCPSLKGLEEGLVVSNDSNSLPAHPFPPPPHPGVRGGPDYPDRGRDEEL